MDVGQVVAGYSLQRTLSATAAVNTFNQGPPLNAITSILGDGRDHYNDSPTITYTPLQGERFARSMMANIPPASIMNVLQAGFPVDVVLRLAVQSINGIDNRRWRAAFRENMFGRRTRSSTCCWNSLAVSRIPATSAYARAPREMTLTLVFRRNHSAAVRQAVRNVTNLLGLDPDATEFRIVYGGRAPQQQGDRAR